MLQGRTLDSGSYVWNPPTTFTSLGETPDLAKIAFAVLPIPSATFQILAMFGREPNEGDVRWYLRDNFKWLYWIGGPLMLVYTMHLAGIV